MDGKAVYANGVRSANVTYDLYTRPLVVYRTYLGARLHLQRWLELTFDKAS